MTTLSENITTADAAINAALIQLDTILLCSETSVDRAHIETLKALLRDAHDYVNRANILHAALNNERARMGS